jgi:hypothetical protein
MWVLLSSIAQATASTPILSHCPVWTERSRAPLTSEPPSGFANPAELRPCSARRFVCDIPRADWKMALERSFECEVAHRLRNIFARKRAIKDGPVPPCGRQRFGPWAVRASGGTGFRIWTRADGIAAASRPGVAHRGAPVLAALSASHHQTVGNAAPPYRGNGSGRPMRSQCAAHTLSWANCGTT